MKIAKKGITCQFCQIFPHSLRVCPKVPPFCKNLHKKNSERYNNIYILHFRIEHW